jgi:hypothetical protein
MPASIPRFLRVGGAFLLAALFLLPQPPAHVRAGTVTVTNTNDGGPGSLRQAIGDALPGDTIDFQPGLTGTIALTTGPLSITKTLTIAGPGPGVLKVDGGGAFPVFIALFNGPLQPATISGLTIQRGFSPDGGAIQVADSILTLTNTMVLTSTAGMGGGVSARFGATVNLIDSTVRGNSGFSQGGGVYADLSATVNLTNTTLIGNDAGGGGGGLRVANATVNLNNSTVRGSVAGIGGGVYVSNGGTVNLTASTLISNTADGQGGGLYAISGALASLTNSTLISNTAGVQGGGVYVSNATVSLAGSALISSTARTGGQGGGAFVNSGTASLTNVTLSGNTADIGGGAFVNSGTVTLINVTLAGNSGVIGAGGLRVAGGVVNLKNTLLAHGAAGSNCVGAITSFGNNLASDATCSLTQPGDLPSTNAMLGPLQNNGGPTLTHALPLLSPAVDAGASSGCPPTDQRGVSRPQLKACDIGAYELARVLFLPAILK